MLLSPESAALQEHNAFFRARRPAGGRRSGTCPVCRFAGRSRWNS